MGIIGHVWDETRKLPFNGADQPLGGFASWSTEEVDSHYFRKSPFRTGPLQSRSCPLRSSSTFSLARERFLDGAAPLRHIW